MRQRSRSVPSALTVGLLFLSLLILSANPARSAKGVNRPPTLTPLANYPARAGTKERLQIAAGDPDGDPLEFRLVRGPSFVSVTTLDPQEGRGEIAISPDSCQVAGTEDCVIAVSDGSASDADTMRIFIKPVTVALPSTPMQSPVGPLSEPVRYDASTVDSTWLLGAWEWQHSIWTRYVGLGLPAVYSGPAKKGYRRRLVLRPGGELELFEIGSNGVLREIRGSYRATHGVGGTKLTLSDWFDPHERAFSVARGGSSFLSLYPWQSSHGDLNRFVRVGDGVANADKRRVIDPLDTATVDRAGHLVSMPESMKAALRKHDPAFHVEERGKGPSAIAGDFDGDLLRDVALLGQSGADQVVIAILSASGNIRAVEVAWRRVLPGGRGRESRGDPAPALPVYLELAPRGTLNPFCWAKREPTPLDGIGIVDSAGVRFDYVMSEAGFTLFAPLR